MGGNLKYRKKSVFVLVAIIAFCLLVELLLMHRNNEALKRSVDIQQQAEALKVNTLDIIRNVHLLDLGLRGYALDSGKAMKSSMDSALSNKAKIFLRVQNSLEYLNYPLDEFNAVKESTNGYFDFIYDLKNLIDEGRRQEFLKYFVEDRGYRVWYDHRVFSKKVNAFADKVAKEAKREYNDAQRNIYMLQVAVLLIVIPTLLYTAYFSNKTVGLAEQLKNSEAERNALLEEQNERLERAVHERTQEILAQNEEIQSQSEEIVSHNEHLVAQQNQIEKQAHQLMQKNEELERIKVAISSKNASLSSEIERQNQHLSAANKELLEQNNRLEQFAYIISHNLRAPIARLIGLTSIADKNDPEDMANVFAMIKHSSQELDGIVKDLTSILSIQRLSPTLYTEIDLAEMMEKLKIIFNHEIAETNATISMNFVARTIYSLSAYVESIFLNLLSNSLKYRHPDRFLRINISSSREDGFVKIHFQDNGIGIDLTKHGQNIFNLYKRFHFHVEGKGIGLFLVKTQVEALGGTITVNSQIDQGTTFEILFRSSAEKPASAQGVS
ncbi:MAG TPA: ATP-binding protein [Chryseosolibacter sp.]